MRALYAWSEAEISDVGGEDVSGFEFGDVDFALEMGYSDFGLRVSMDVRRALRLAQCTSSKYVSCSGKRHPSISGSSRMRARGYA